VRGDLLGVYFCRPSDDELGAVPDSDADVFIRMRLWDDIRGTVYLLADAVTDNYGVSDTHEAVVDRVDELHARFEIGEERQRPAN
jgi:hypothetical protein